MAVQLLGKLTLKPLLSKVLNYTANVSKIKQKKKFLQGSLLVVAVEVKHIKQVYISLLHCGGKIYSLALVNWVILLFVI